MKNMNAGYYHTQEQVEGIAAEQFVTLPGSYTELSDRRRVVARGLVQQMQANGLLPERMSDKRFSQIADYIAAGMKAAVRDAMDAQWEFPSV